jgi:hypothetical protein
VHAEMRKRALTRAHLPSQQQMCLLLREALSVGKISIAHEFFSNELKHTEAKLRIKDELSATAWSRSRPRPRLEKFAQPTRANSTVL